jgi:hypothetical protein
VLETIGNAWHDAAALRHANCAPLPHPHLRGPFHAHPHAGLADRLATSVTVFLYALLSDRAFQYDFPGDPLWQALHSDFIDWRYTGVDSGNATLLMDYVDKGLVDLDDGPQPGYMKLFTHGNTSAIGEGYHSVVWQSDHAAVWAAYGNPLVAGRLAAWGLPRENAFACLFDYLYRPSEDVLQAVRPQLGPLLDDSALRIGLQARTGEAGGACGSKGRGKRAGCIRDSGDGEGRRRGTGRNLMQRIGVQAYTGVKAGG